MKFLWGFIAGALSVSGIIVGVILLADKIAAINVIKIPAESDEDIE